MKSLPILFITALASFTTSCISIVKKDDITHIQQLVYYIGEYEVTAHNDTLIKISVNNSPTIRKVKETQSQHFSYGQYASIIALMALPELHKKISRVNVQIIDSTYAITYTYSKAELSDIDKKISEARKFTDNIIKKDFKSATQYFSDTIRNSTELSNQFFNYYFSHKFSKYEIIAFKRLNDTYVGLYFTFALDDGRRQTYIYWYELFGSDKIANITVPEKNTFL